MITLATNTLAEIIGYTTNLFDDLKLLILLLIGLPLGFWILEAIISVFRTKKDL